MSRTSEPLGNDAALRQRFEELFEAHYRKILTYARRRTCSEEDADDVAASTFTVAWSRVDDFVGADQPLAWLYAVAYRTVLSQRRNVDKDARLAKKVADQYPGPVQSIELTVEVREELAHATAAAATLSEKDQEILRLVGWEECTHAELAESLGISRVLVRTRLLRARRHLQAATDKRLDGSTGKGATDD